MRTAPRPSQTGHHSALRLATWNRRAATRGLKTPVALLHRTWVVFFAVKAVRVRCNAQEPPVARTSPGLHVMAAEPLGACPPPRRVVVPPARAHQKQCHCAPLGHPCGTVMHIVCIDFRCCLTLVVWASLSQAQGQTSGINHANQSFAACDPHIVHSRSGATPSVVNVHHVNHNINSSNVQT